MRLALRHKQQVIDIELNRDGGQYRVDVDGQEYVVDAHYADDDTLILTIGDEHHRVDLARSSRDRLVSVGGESYTFVPETGTSSAHVVGSMAVPEIVAPMPGKVLQVLVTAGDRVEVGDGLLILEAMKMENRLLAEAPALVEEVRVAAGDMVEGGQVLVVLKYED